MLLSDVEGNGEDTWCTLEPDKHMTTTQGSVMIRVTKNAEFVRPALTITAVQARGLRAADRGGTSDPYCVITLYGVDGRVIESTKRKTPVVKKV